MSVKSITIQHSDTKFPCTFSKLNGVEIKITHSVAPINLHTSINGISMSRRSNVCPTLTNLDSYINLFLETSMS